MFQLAVFVHVLAALSLVAGSIGALATSLSARRTSSSATILAFMKLHHGFSTTLVLPGSSVALLSGLYLTHTAGFSWTSLWIAGALFTWVLALLLGAIVLGPSEENVMEEVERCVNSGEP